MLPASSTVTGWYSEYMAYSQKYCLVQLLAPMSTGDEFHSKDWPLHCTIAGVFALNLTDTARQSFIDMVARHTAFESKATAIDWFGPQKTVKVRHVAMTDELYSLHDEVVSFIEQNGGVFNEPLYLREYFAPHITMRADEPEAGQIVSIYQLVLIDMFPDGDHTRRRIIAQMPLAKRRAP